jgi:plastocyanin
MTARVVAAFMLLGWALAPAMAQVSVSGKLTTADGHAPGEVVVYLESTDPAARFPPPPDAEISQKGATFAPSLLVICAGQSVQFKNDEERPLEHNVFSKSPTMPFDLGLFKPPQAKRVTFSAPGLVRLYCSIHRFMDGMIYVCPTPFFARVQPDGSYTIANVPPGKWRLKTWQRSPRYPEQELAVSTSSAVERDIQLNRK